MPSFEQKMGELKKPREMGDFGTEEMRDLDHAIEILTALRIDAKGEREVAWEKLHDAVKYLEKLQKKHLEDPEKKTE